MLRLKAERVRGAIDVGNSGVQRGTAKKMRSPGWSQIVAQVYATRERERELSAAASDASSAGGVAQRLQRLEEVVNR